MAYWQEFLPAAQDRPAVWHDHFDAAMPDGKGLRLPLRDLGATAVAGMIANQASFAVFDRGGGGWRVRAGSAADGTPLAAVSAGC